MWEGLTWKRQEQIIYLCRINWRVGWLILLLKVIIKQFIYNNLIIQEWKCSTAIEAIKINILFLFVLICIPTRSIILSDHAVIKILQLSFFDMFKVPVRSYGLLYLCYMVFFLFYMKSPVKIAAEFCWVCTVHKTL